MTFFQSIRSVLWTNYANFSGRAARSEYWWYRIFTAIVAGALAMIFYFGGAQNWEILLFEIAQTGQIGSLAFGPETGWMRFAGIGAAIFSIYILIPTLAVSVRRFHDVNLSAWWLFALWIGSVLFSTIWFYPIIALLCAVTILVICILPSTPAQNRYGANPVK